MVAEELLNGLNPAQKQVASTTKGPLLVLAGAGTGKTRCVIYRAGYLIASGCVRKENLLIVTFTNKAARELRQRLADTFNLACNNLWVGTFHSIFGKILRFEAAHLPFSANYVIFDDKDQKNLVKKIIKELNLDPKQFKYQAVRGIISRQKNNLCKPEQFWEFNDYTPRSKEVLKVYTRYQEYLKAQNALDFDDILMNMAYLLAENEEVRQKWQKRFQYIMIDEYQDTNYAQFEIIHSLAKDHQNICVVGDDDQAIYTWRGATIKNIMNFENDYDNVVKIRLERNYRSHENILKLANSLIKHNTSRHGKELYTDYVIDEKPHITALDNEAGEAEYIAELIIDFHNDSIYAECAVLYRTNAQSRIIEKIFVQKNIPYRIYGGVNFYQRKEIKDILCFLRMIINPEDQVSVQRALLLTPGVGKSTFEKIALAAKNQNIDISQVILNGEYSFLGSRPAKLTTGFKDICLQLIEAAHKLSIYDLIWQLLKITGLGSLYGLDRKKDIITKKTFSDPEFQSKYENICELLLSAHEFSHEFSLENDTPPDLAEYLASATLQTDLDTNNDEHDKVNLMTMHNAKGLEFDHVIIVGLEDGILPHRRSLDEESTIEEERRLLYVAITRARQTVHITLARWRRMATGIDISKPSRFIKDFDKEYIDGQRYDAHAYLTPSRPTRAKPKYAAKVVLESEKHFKIGQKIKHVNFGFGLILSVDGQGRDARLTIKFDRGPIKKILGSYVNVIEK